MGLDCLLLLFFCCILQRLVLVNGENHTDRTYFQNITLCDLNITSYEEYFPWLVEGFAIAPLLTHLVSFVALTFAHALDTVFLGSIMILALLQHKFIIGSIFSVFTCIACALFLRHAVENFLSWRFACTRHTNFILAKDKVAVPYKGKVVVESGGQVLTSAGPVKLDKLILGGRLAEKISTTTAERWSA